MFISRGGSWAGRTQGASPSLGLLLRPAAAPEPWRRDFRSLPVPRRRAGASLQRAARAGAALGCADNGGREGGGRADSTYLPGKRSRALPSKRLPDRRDRKWRGRWGSPLLPPSRPHAHGRHLAGEDVWTPAPLLGGLPGDAVRAWRSSPAAPGSCRTDGAGGNAGNNSGEEALCSSPLLQTFASASGSLTAPCQAWEVRTKGLPRCSTGVWSPSLYVRAAQQLPGAGICRMFGSYRLSWCSCCGAGNGTGPSGPLTAGLGSGSAGELPHRQVCNGCRHWANASGAGGAAGLNTQPLPLHPQGLTRSACHSSCPTADHGLIRSQPRSHGTGASGEMLRSHHQPCLLLLRRWLGLFALPCPARH